MEFRYEKSVVSIRLAKINGNVNAFIVSKKMALQIIKKKILFFRKKRQIKEIIKLFIIWF